MIVSFPTQPPITLRLYCQICGVESSASADAFLRVQPFCSVDLEPLIVLSAEDQGANTSLAAADPTTPDDCDSRMS